MKRVWETLKTAGGWIVLVGGALLGFIFARVRRSGSTGGVVSDTRDSGADDRARVDTVRRGLDDSQERITIVNGRIERSTGSIDSAISHGRTVRDILDKVKSQGNSVEKPSDNGGSDSGG